MVCYSVAGGCQRIIIKGMFLINKTIRNLIFFFFGLYTLVLVYFVFIYNRISISDSVITYVTPYVTPRYNLIPFRTIMDYIKQEMNNLINTKTVCRELFGNIFLYLPIPIFLTFLTNKSTKRIILISLIIIVIAEGLQGLLKVGVFDVDDMILNSIGIILGILLGKAIKSIFNITKEHNYEKKGT